MASQSPAAPSPRGVPKIPTEVVQQFFAFFATTLSTNKIGQFPWFLGHICSTWRLIFLSMDTEFWHSISISFSQERCERTENVVRFFLERDPAAPFSFKAVEPTSAFRSRSGVDHILQIMDILADASMRWKGATFSMRAQCLLPLIRTKNHLPLLQELRMCLFASEIPDLLFDLFQDAPSLDAVTMDYLADWKFNWSNLKVVTVYVLGCSAPDFVAALPQMVKLERLYIGITSDPAMSSTIILLPNVTTLNCKSNWLRFLETPALKYLTIHYWASESFDTTLSFFHRSRCSANISSLTIKLAQGATAAEIIRHTPNILHLDLRSVGNLGNVLKQLTISTNPTRGGSLARHMLSLSIDEASEEHMKPLIDLISSRTVNVMADNFGYKRLQKLVVYENKSSISNIAKQNLIALCEERGVQVMI